MSIFFQVVILVFIINVTLTQFVPRSDSISAKGCRDSIPSFSEVKQIPRLLHITEGPPKSIQVERLRKISDQFTDLYISFDLFDRKPCPLDSWIPISDNFPDLYISFDLFDRKPCSVSDNFPNLYISFNIFDQKPCPLDSVIRWSINPSLFEAKFISEYLNIFCFKNLKIHFTLLWLLQSISVLQKSLEAWFAFIVHVQILLNMIAVAQARSCGQFIEIFADDLGRGISKPQHMACEVLRMNSFKHRPYDSYKGIWPSQLAKAGLYYDPRSEDTICFVCDFRKPASFWVKGRNPFHFHIIGSPNCKYITGHCKENVPFHTQEQIKSQLSYLEPNSSGNRPAPNQDPGRLVADGTAPTGHPSSSQITESVIQEQSNSFNIESRNRLRQHQNQGSAEHVQSLPIVSSSSSLGPNSLGYHQQQHSELPFQSLPGTVNGEHQMSLNSLPVARPAPPVKPDHPNEVANSFRSNTSINNTRINNSSSNNTTSAPASLPYQSSGNENAAPISLQYRSQSSGQTVRATVNRSTGQPGMFDADGPQPLQRMRSEEARLMTYTRWPNHAAVSPDDLARAGFFYTGSNDRVQCAFCENVLRNWEAGDNPTFEHRRHFPRCRFVLGQDVGNVPIPPAQRQRAQVDFTPKLKQ